MEPLTKVSPPAYTWQAIAAMVIGAALVILAFVIFLFQVATPVENRPGSWKVYSQVTKLAPLGCPVNEQTDGGRLCDYYVAGSAYSVFPSAKVYDYVSDKILPLVVKAGARIIELDIYSDPDGNPVVGLKNQQTGTDYAYNTVSFSSCCVNICNTAFNSAMTPVASDPFILSLVFQTKNTTTMNACAQILKNTCGKYLLPSEYSYERKNLAVEPVCNLQNKLIVISGDAKGTLLEELVNMSWTSSHLRRLTYTQASQPYDHEELVKFNRNNITIVVPDLGSDLKNVNPQILLTYGCQWNLMNYGSIDDMMELYIGEFQMGSFVLKPLALRALKPKKYKTPVLPDPTVSFQPMQKTSPIYNVTI